MSIYTEDPYDTIQRCGTPIWENIYEVRMRSVDRISTEDLAKFGVPTTFDPLLDQQLQNEQITVYLTIDAVFEHYRGNRRVEFANNKDSEAAYHIVNNYLRAWDTLMRDGINIGNAPIADLLQLDEFAHKLFIQARMFNGRQVHKTASFVNSLRRGRGTSRTALLGQGADGKPPSEAKEEIHRSVAESLTRQLPLNEQPVEDRRKSPAHRWRP